MKIPFDIKFKPQIESGEYKVENRDGDIVTILEWDIFIHGMAHMILIRYNEKYEFVNYNGRVNRTGQDCNLDLFIITPEPEFTEFEKRLWEIMKSEGSPIGPMDNFTQDDERVFHAYSDQLLALARKEIRDEIEFRGEEYQTGYKDGKAEALKDLPRWKKCEHEMHTLTNLLIRSIDAMWIGAYVKEGQYYIPTNDLILKLPGFNE